MAGARRLTKLTTEQEALLPVVRDEWLQYGLSTEPAEREDAAHGVRVAYQEAGLAPPRVVIWLGSPLEGAIGAELLKRLGASDRQVRDQVWRQVRDQVGDQVRGQVRDQVWDQVRDQVRGQVRDQVRGQVRDQVGGQVWDQVGDQVGGQVGDQVGGQVWGQVWDQVWGQVGDQVRGQVGGQVWGQVWRQVGGQVRGQVGDQVWDQVWGQVRDQVRDQVWRAVYGQHEAGWLSFFDAFRRMGIKGPERLTGCFIIAMSAGWWWPFENAVILTERPRCLRRDDEGRLHSDTGPALLYPDGFGIWAHHGVRVPRDVIEAADDIGAGRISQEPNVEVRRVMLERYGADRYMRESHAALQHEDEWGRLWRLPQADDEDFCMVEVVNSTPEPDGEYKTYWLRVDPVCETALQAVAWTFDRTPEEYLGLCAQT